MNSALIVLHGYFSAIWRWWNQFTSSVSCTLSFWCMYSYHIY